jgi:multiple sugar transport system permease protein
LNQKNSYFRRVLKNTDKYLMVLPFFALFTVFTIIPVVFSIVLSFTDFNLLQTPNFVSWGNYIKLFLQDKVFIISAKNTFVFAVLTGPISYFLCLIVAWLVNELPPAFRTVMTFLFYAPTISSNLYVIWSYIFSGDIYGWANGLLMMLGIIREPIYWFTDPKYILQLIMIVQLWMCLGTSFLAFIAGLQSIDRSLYEAGAVDGIKNRWQELVYITIPSMGPQLLFGAVIQIAASFSVGRISIDLCGLPSTDYAGSTIITEAIDYGTIRYEMGYACALATVLFITMVLMNHAVRKILSKYL